MTVTSEADPGGSGPLAEFVDQLVASYELWTRIPQCWQKHAQVVHEMRALRELHLWTEEAAANDPSQGAAGRANWHDHLGRVLARLADGPNATCAKARTHRVAQSWDDDEFLARVAAQRTR